jgi:hypothetical protein
VVQQQEREESRHAAISIGEGVNAQKIEHVRRNHARGRPHLMWSRSLAARVGRDTMPPGSPLPAYFLVLKQGVRLM